MCTAITPALEKVKKEKGEHLIHHILELRRKTEISMIAKFVCDPNLVESLSTNLLKC